MDPTDEGPRARRAGLLLAAEAQGLLGSKGRHLGGRFPDSLVEAAKRASGITETTELLTYALIKVALEDDFATRLLDRQGSVPSGLLFAG